MLSILLPVLCPKGHKLSCFVILDIYELIPKEVRCQDLRAGIHWIPWATEKKIRVEKCLGEANSTQDMERAEEEKPDEVGREKRDEKRWSWTWNPPRPKKVVRMIAAFVLQNTNGRSSPSNSRSRTHGFNSKVQPLVKSVSSTKEADSLYLLGTRSDD